MDLIKLTRSDFDSFYSLVKESFIEEERRDYPDALRLFKEEKYEILGIIHDGKTVGFISLWNFSDFVFAEHFVMYGEYRNLGLGSKTLKLLEEKYKRIVLEAEPPFADLQKRRLGFYKRNGFVENPGQYIQPPYRKGSDGVELVIMSYPDALEDFNATIREIKSCVYPLL